MTQRRRFGYAALTLVSSLVVASCASLPPPRLEANQTLQLRAMPVRISGGPLEIHLARRVPPRANAPLVVFASGDGGWFGTAVGMFETVATAGYPVVGVSSRALLRGLRPPGQGDANELGWRWKDALIDLTHGVPNEPRFSTIAVAGRVAPTPLAVINSTHDEFVPAGEVDRIVAAAQQPKRLWTIAAADHRFSDKQIELAARLAEAIDWVRKNDPK